MDNYYESDEPFYSALRSVGTRLGRLFDENEQAKVIRAVREVDPHFSMETFQTELREYIVPEVIDAFLSADRTDMKSWMSEAAFNVSWAVLGEYIKSGLVSASQVVEISNVDVLQAKFLNDTVPVFLVTCEGQEIHAWKSAKTGEVKVGDVSSVKRSRYVFAMTITESETYNELTGGWKVVEVGVTLPLLVSLSLTPVCSQGDVRCSLIAPFLHMHHHSTTGAGKDPSTRLTASSHAYINLGRGWRDRVRMNLNFAYPWSVIHNACYTHNILKLVHDGTAAKSICPPRLILQHLPNSKFCLFFLVVFCFLPSTKAR